MTLAFSPDSIVLDTRHLIGGVRHADISACRSSAHPTARRPRSFPSPMPRWWTAVQKAHQALQGLRLGARRPAGERTRILHRWADLIEAHATSSRVWRPWFSTRPVDELPAGDIAVTAEQIRFFAELADKEGGTVAPTREESLGLIIDAPVGVIGAITPWNFPLSMAGWKMGPALAAGNAIVLKPSEIDAPSRRCAWRSSPSRPAFRPADQHHPRRWPDNGRRARRPSGIGKVSFTGSTKAAPPSPAISRRRA